MKKIIFVCNGNICRSPMAKSILEKLLKDKKIKDKYAVFSCGINAVNGLEMNDNAKKVLKENKIKPCNHLSKRLDEKDILSSDYVITMTTEQKEFLENYNNVYSLNDLTKCGEIVDPYGEDYAVYQKVFDALFKSMNNLIKFLESEVWFILPTTMVELS